MEELKPLLDAIMAQPTWVEFNTLLAQQDMRERCANVAVDVAKRLLVERDKRIAELEDRNTLLDGNFEIASNIAIGLAERYQQELAQARHRIAELEAALDDLTEENVNLRSVLNGG